MIENFDWKSSKKFCELNQPILIKLNALILIISEIDKKTFLSQGEESGGKQEVQIDSPPAEDTQVDNFNKKK